MHKKLVRYDSWHFTEVDPIRLNRAARTLRDQILKKVSQDDDPYEFYTLTIPVLDAALRGDITSSLDDDEQEIISANYKHDKTEGFLPQNYDRGFREAVADFEVTALGLSLEEHRFFTINGETYAEIEFEDEGDWPDKVKYP